MDKKIIISGFADEIDPQLDVQLKVVKDLGMEYICFRAADGKGVAEYTLDEVKESILPRLNAAGVKVSSLGSPIGKIDIDDDAAYEKQLAQLDTLCQICNLLDCKYIRMFSLISSTVYSAMPLPSAARRQMWVMPSLLTHSS